MIKKLFSIIVIAFGLISFGSSAENQDPSKWSVEDLANMVGVYCWSVTIPDKVKSNEYLSTFWVLPDGKIENGTGLSFKTAKKGTEVKIVIWRNISSKGEMRFSLDFIDLTGKRKRSQGQLKAPIGFRQIFGSADNFSELIVKEGNILYLSDMAGDKICILHFEIKKL